MVTVFGQPSTPKIISLSLDGNQFEIYNKIARNYKHSFLFESLTGPEELSETSIMGFDPEFIVKQDTICIYSELHYRFIDWLTFWNFLP